MSETGTVSRIIGNMRAAARATKATNMKAITWVRVTAMVALLPLCAAAQNTTSAAAQNPAPAAAAVPAQSTAGSRYTGSLACQSCHAQIYERWKKTPMANVVRDPREHPEAILPDLSRNPIRW